MEALILAGGLGTRLRSVVADVPKVMAPIDGHPFLEILLHSLSRKGFQTVVLSIGYMADKVIAHFGDQFAGMSIKYVTESTPLGTGGALRGALAECVSDHVFVFNGDTFLDVEASMIEEHWKVRQRPLLVACTVPDTTRYGRLEITENSVTGILGKNIPGPGPINAGCYVLPKNILNAFPTDTAFSFESEFLTKALSNQEFDLFITKGHFIDIGIPEDYSRAQKELAGFLKA
jgi:D-glycero-alpha-D-manno-heptose 1-phosphate guanylyltransferase